MRAYAVWLPMPPALPNNKKPPLKRGHRPIFTLHFLTVKIHPLFCFRAQANQHFIQICIKNLLPIGGIIAKALLRRTNRLMAVVSCADTDTGTVIFPDLAVKRIAVPPCRLERKADAALPCAGINLAHHIAQNTARRFIGQPFNIEADQRDFLLTAQMAAMPIIVSTFTEKRKVDIPLILAVDQRDRVIAPSLTGVIAKGKSVAAERCTAVHADNMLSAHLDALIKPPYLYIGIVAVIIIAAVRHGQSDTPARCNRRHFIQADQAVFANQVAIADQRHVFDLDTIDAAQIHAANRVLIVRKHNRKIFDSKRRSILHAFGCPCAPQHICRLPDRVQGLCRDIQHNAVSVALLHAIFMVLADQTDLAPGIWNTERCVRAAVLMAEKAVNVIYAIHKKQIFVLSDALIDRRLERPLIVFPGACIIRLYGPRIAVRYDNDIQTVHNCLLLCVILILCTLYVGRNLFYTLFFCTILHLFELRLFFCAIPEKSKKRERITNSYITFLLPMKYTDYIWHIGEAVHPMKLQTKVILILVLTLTLLCSVIISIWYRASSELTDIYLEDVSKTSMRDACNAFEYLLTDTTYMAALVATNQKNIVEPITRLNSAILMHGRQWNQTYLENRRLIMDLLSALNGYKYYIPGITVIANPDCYFDNSYAVRFRDNLMEKIQALDPDEIRYSMVMLEPMQNVSRSNSSDSFVLPGVRAVLNQEQEIIGYVVVYFDYRVIEQMFMSYLSDGCFFQVVNDNGGLIFSNTGSQIDMDGLQGLYAKNTFRAENVGWTFSIAVPSDYYIAELRRSVLVTGMWMIAIIALAGFLCVFMVSHSISEIGVLRSQIEVISNGDFSARYQVRTRDEIGQVGAAFNRMIDRIQSLMQKISSDEREKRMTELAFLQAQINPHFVSNVLNNVAWMAKLQHADNIIPLVNSLNALLRNVVHQEHTLIPLSDELDYVDNYLTIMGYSGSYDFTVCRQISADAQHVYVLRFILQPIIENAIVHGMPADLSRQGSIKIQAEIVGKTLQIVIEDNGKGMTEEEIRQLMDGKRRSGHTFSGIGVTNVNERIRLYYGENYGLRFESVLHTYTRCIITLPIVEEGRE